MIASGTPLGPPAHEAGSPEPVADSSHLSKAIRGTTMRRLSRMAGSSPRRAAADALARLIPKRTAASSTFMVTRSTLLLGVCDQVIVGRTVTSPAPAV